MSILFLLFSHDYSNDLRYNDNYYKNMEKKAVNYYKKAGVNYILVKYKDIENDFEEKDNTLYIKGLEDYDYKTCNYKDKIAFNYYKNKYTYIYKSTITSLPNLKMIYDIIKEFENSNLDFLYCGPTFFQTEIKEWFVGGFSILLNDKSIEKILSYEWHTNDDETIASILNPYIISKPYFANHDGITDTSYKEYYVVKFCMYKDQKMPEIDYILHDIVSNIFLSLL